LLHHIFQQQYLTRTTVPGFVSEERKLREYLRMIDIPPYVWIIQEATEKASVHGSILDIREDSQFRGEYDTQGQSVTIFGTTKDGIPATISMYKRDNKVETKIETRAAYVGGPQRSGGGVT